MQQLPHPRQASALRRSRVAGFTLVEMLMVVVIIGILVTLAFPRLSDALARRDVQGATAAFGTLYREARAAALQRRQAATIQYSGGVAVITISPGGVLDTIGSPLNFVGQFGVLPTVSGASLRIEPTGLILTGTPFTLTAEKRGVADTLTIVGLGRVQ